MSKRGWAYAAQGDYHRNLNADWSYAPTYRRKTKVVDAFVAGLHVESVLLDIGAGEGVFVERYRKQGRTVFGIDPNYESRFVVPADGLKLPIRSGSIDVVLLLDTLEHFPYNNQGLLLDEIRRVLVPNGHLVCAVPNLAHLNSRFRFLISGGLDRTDSELNHLGERPFRENRDLLQSKGFSIERVTGITLTVPGLYRGVICRKPSWFTWMHNLFEPLARVLPSWAMLSVYFCRSPE